MKRNLLWLTAMLLLLTGCWDQRELTDLTVVTGMAVDKGENGRYKLTVEAINTVELNSKTAGGNSPSFVYSLEGDTVEELSRKMNIGLLTNLLTSWRLPLVDLN